MTSRSALPACAGLIAGPLAWAVNTQLGLILPDVDCSAWFRPSAPAALLLVAGALAAGYLSWRARADRPEALRFIAVVSALSAFLFAFGLLLQAAASLLLTGCER
ncbi:MAG: hypothetical protein JO264_21240 [Acidisphaera sp.]|nr:hypothetical protein [Acidisphaera sp.]